MGNILESLETLKTKMSKIAEATRALAGTTKNLTLDEIPELILKNTGTFCYYLGEGTSFNVKDYFPSTYQKFTEDNFIVSVGQINQPSIDMRNNWNSIKNYPVRNGSVSKKYDATTGSLTVSVTTATSKASGTYKVDYNEMLSSDYTVTALASASIIPKVYVVSSIRTAGEGNYCYYLGTLSGNTFDVKSMFPDKYATFTNENFIIQANGVNSFSSNFTDGFNSYSSSGCSITKKYDQNNGILTVGGRSFNIYGHGNYGADATGVMSLSVYLVSNATDILSISVTPIGSSYTAPHTGIIYFSANATVTNHDNSWEGDFSMYAYHNGSVVKGTSCHVGAWGGGSMKISGQFHVAKGDTFSLSINTANDDSINWTSNHSNIYCQLLND